jgi:hypothetical protein
VAHLKGEKVLRSFEFLFEFLGVFVQEILFLKFFGGENLEGYKKR